MEKRFLKHIVAIVISSVTLSISALAGEQTKPPKDLDLNGSDCILIRTIRDYTPLSRDSLLIHASGKRSYFVRLFGPSFGLNSAFQLATKSRDERLCPYGGDSIIFDTLPGGEAKIRSISRVNQAQLEQILIHYGKKDPGDTEDQAPPEIDGADVEELG